MKFSTAAAMGVLVAATAVGNIQAFAPTKTTILSSSSPHFLQVSHASTSTQLGVFGLFKGAGSTKVAPTKAAKEIATAKTGDAPILEDSQVQDLFYMWNDALKTLEPQMVAKRYASQAILLPTVSDTPRTDPEGLVDYFTNFLKVLYFVVLFVVVSTTTVSSFISFQYTLTARTGRNDFAEPSLCGTRMVSRCGDL